jgi:IS5 family transposase
LRAFAGCFEVSAFAGLEGRDGRYLALIGTLGRDRANRALRSVRTRLGRVFRDIVRKTRDDANLRRIFAEPLSLAFRVRHQRHNQRGQKVYSLHALEVECVGKGKAHRPYEFGVKVSVATTLARSKGGQFTAHVKTLPGNPYDGHTLETEIPEIETQIGASLSRIVADRATAATTLGATTK